MKLLYEAGIIKRPSFLGKTHSDETKEMMRKSRNKGSQNSQFGTMWITNGNENKKMNKTDIIPDGWYKGRTCTLLA